MTLKRFYSARSSISSDLVLSASMGYSGGKISRTHGEHADTLKKINIYEDSRIDHVIRTLDKIDFCQ